MSLYSQFAEKIIYISPRFFKKRFFKKLINLNTNLVKSRNIEPELFWLQSFLNKDSVVLDIGANVGSYLFIFENFLNSNQIFAFEPNAELANRLKKIYKKIEILQVALSDENGEFDFKIPIINGNKVHSRGTLQVKNIENNEFNSVLKSVKVIKLDDWVNSKKLSKIDFIKIDVEGNEMQTLRGSKNTLIKYKPTFMVEMEQRHHKIPLCDLVSEVESWGFVSHYLCRESFVLKKITPEFYSNQLKNQDKGHWDYINNIIFVAN